MFLAINELNKEKGRFALIVFVIVLMSYLTFFLTSLAYGLATSYTRGVEKWNASGIVLNKDANNTVERSLLLEADYAPLEDGSTAPLGVSGATINSDTSKDVSLFGIEFDGFLAPNITEGRLPQDPNQVVVSDELESEGVSLGQSLRFKGLDQELEVVGFTDNATFQTAPVVYVELSEWRALASDIAGMTGMKDQTTINALVTKGEVDASHYDSEKIEWISIQDFSFDLPGYRAQVLTFGLMIGFLIAIASFVLAVFMYILTLQKKSIFGVLKAEGVPNGYISRSVMIQILLLCLTGLAIGLALTIISGIALASVVPFLINPLFFVGITALFLLCGAIGGIASVRAVTKIDPVEAIG